MCTCVYNIKAVFCFNINSLSALHLHAVAKVPYGLKMLAHNHNAGLYLIRLYEIVSLCCDNYKLVAFLLSIECLLFSMVGYLYTIFFCYIFIVKNVRHSWMI